MLFSLLIVLTTRPYPSELAYTVNTYQCSKIDAIWSRPPQFGIRYKGTEIEVQYETYDKFYDFYLSKCTK